MIAFLADIPLLTLLFALLTAAIALGTAVWGLLCRRHWVRSFRELRALQMDLARLEFSGLSHRDLHDSGRAAVRHEFVGLVVRHEG